MGRFDKAWTVVQFMSKGDSDEIATVPSKWIHNFPVGEMLYCFWPNKKIRKAIQKAEDPDETWMRYAITILKETDNYEEALAFEKKCSESEEDENLSRQNKLKYRKRKINKNDDFVSDMSSEEDDEIFLPPLPKLRKSDNTVEVSKKQNDSSEVKSSEAAVDDTSGSSGSNQTSDTLSLDDEDSFMLMPPPSSVRIIKKSISDKVCSLQKDRSISLNDSSNINLANERIVDGNKTINIESIEEMITGASRERSIANETSCCCVHVRKILENVIAVRTLVNEQTIVLERKYGQNLVDHVTNFDTVPTKPFDRYRKLMKYEDLLKESAEGKKQLETVFYIGGGCDENDAIKRGLKRLFTNKLATKCSWTGRKQNFPLKDLIAISILKDAVRKRFVSLTDTLFETRVALWFRQAPLRFSRDSN